MKRILALAMGMLLATGCYQTSETNIEKQGTPSGNAADSVDLPNDVWSTDSCIADSDCTGKFSPGYCEKEACVEGTCKVVPVVAGTTCYDPTVAVQACEVRVCKQDGEALACKVASAPDGLACGVFYASCGGAGICRAGSCVDPCIGDDPCKVGSCSTSGCQYQPTNEGQACDDGNSCTTNDLCTSGTCTGTLSCQCASDDDCKALDDDDLCNGTLVCKDGQCQVKAGSVVTCQATGQEPCVVNQCNPATGLCAESQPSTPTPCSDGIECTKGDQCENGTCSHFANITCEYLCDDGNDEDDDGKTDCDDSDCFGIGECPAASCGDATCNGEETCVTCEADCGVCPPECGDGTCNGEETCSTCGLDCGACPPACGDGTCNGDENCTSCEADCGACPASCGDGTCNGDETCDTCLADCGPCAPVCGDGACTGDETCSSCEADCGACTPECGDGTCNGTEDCASCAGDCGACDYCTGYTGDSVCCQNGDPCGYGSDDYCDCDGKCAWDSDDCPACGDGVCAASENCGSCAADCGACDFCPGYEGSSECCQNGDPCGYGDDGYCDCDGKCSWDATTDCLVTVCGDGVCNGDELCTNCEADCGACVYCTGYTGTDGCCTEANNCGYDADGYCDCGGFCTWDSADCG